jgi:hypothetical protein
MAESIWEKGRLTAVFQQVGVRSDDGKKRFRYANFDVLEWASVDGNPPVLYILTAGGDSLTAPDINLKEDEKAGREFGYYQLDPLIIDACEADGKSDSWRSLHSFGPI